MARFINLYTKLHTLSKHGKGTPTMFEKAESIAHLSRPEVKYIIKLQSIINVRITITIIIFIINIITIIILIIAVIIIIIKNINKLHPN